MPANTRENKAVEAMVARYHEALDRSDERDEGLRSIKASALALADNVTDEMAERGGRHLCSLFGSGPTCRLDGCRGSPEACPNGHDFADEARAAFAEMCRAAAGTD